MSHRYVVRLNGVRLSYTDDGQGQPIVLVHGFPLDHRIWLPQVDALKADHRVITLDLPGFGDSEAHLVTPGMTGYAEDLAALLRHLHTGPVVLGGHSMGGYIALAFAKAHPDLLRGLMLVATEADLDSAEVAATYAPTLAAVAKDGSTPVIADFAPLLTGPAGAGRLRQPQVRDLMAAATPVGITGALIGMRDRADSTPVLPTIGVPTLIVVGTADQVIQPGKSKRMAQTIPGAKLVELDGIGHLPSLEAPEAVIAAMRNWLQTAPRR